MDTLIFPSFGHSSTFFNLFSFTPGVGYMLHVGSRTGVKLIDKEEYDGGPVGVGGRQDRTG